MLSKFSVPQHYLRPSGSTTVVLILILIHVNSYVYLISLDFTKFIERVPSFCSFDKIIFMKINVTYNLIDQVSQPYTIPLWTHALSSILFTVFPEIKYEITTNPVISRDKPWDKTWDNYKPCHYLEIKREIKREIITKPVNISRYNMK